MKRFANDPRVLFLLAGGFNTVFGVAVFAGLVTLFGGGVPAVVSVLLTWLISVPVACFVHRKWVFRVEGQAWRDLARFAAANAAFLFVNLATVAFLVDHHGLDAIPVQIGMVVVIVVFSYVTHKNFSFRRSTARKSLDVES